MDRDPTHYAEAATCSLNISRNCHDPDGSLRLVPDTHDVLAGVQRLCDVRDREWNAPALICHSDARNLIFITGCHRVGSLLQKFDWYAWSVCLPV